MRKRLGEMLIEAGALDHAQLQAALWHQRNRGGRLGQAIVSLKLATEEQIAEALSKKLGFERVRPAALQPGPVLDAAIKAVPKEFAVQHNLLPYAIDPGTISVAMSDPANIAVMDELSFRTGRRVKIALAGDREISEAVRRHYVERKHASRKKANASEIGTGSARIGEMEPLAASASCPSPTRPAPAQDAPQKPGPEPLPPPTDLLPTEVALANDLTPHPTAAQPAPPDASAAPLGPSRTATPVPPCPPAASAATAATTGERSVDGWTILDALEHLAKGEPVSPELVTPAQMAAALVRVLIRKNVISEHEFLAELAKD